MTAHQKLIIKLCHECGGTITKKHVVEAYGHWHYTNEAFHIGNTLSRMVKNGMLKREKPGVFKIGKGTKSNPTTIAEGQTTLFEI